MATTYALPAMNGHSAAHHGHSHSRKSAAKLSPLQQTAMNGGYHSHAGSTVNDLLKPPLTPLHQSQSSADVPDETHSDQSTSFPQLSSPIPSFSTHTYSRSKSMERRKSVGLPTHLHLQGDGYGVSPSTARRFRSNTLEPGTSLPWFTKAEAISSILIPLPYVLASISQNYVGIAREPKTKLEHTQIPASKTCDWLLLCALVSVTLLLVGFLGRFGKSNGVLERRKLSLTLKDQALAAQSLGWGRKASKILSRSCAVGIPFYAVSKLGAARVVLVMLVGLSSKLVAVEEESTDLTSFKTWRLLFAHRKWTVGSLILQLVCDLSGRTNSSALSSICLGYVALALCIFVQPPPFPSSRPKVSTTMSSNIAPDSSTSTIHATSWAIPSQIKELPASESWMSPLICSAEDTEITLWSGGLMGALSIIMFVLLRSSGLNLSPSQVGWNFLASSATALALTVTKPKSLRDSQGLGLVFGSLLSSFTLAQLGIDQWSQFTFQAVLIGISFVCAKFDTQAASFSASKSKHHHYSIKSHSADHAQMSRFSEFVLRNTPESQLLRSIMVEKDSRRILYFMCLNFAFMLVQTFYGLATGSLGLLSDSIHMFFDCIALVVGLCAAVMSKWPPSTRFPYGYGKMDTLAGFANGIFLMLISLEIVYEALERLAEGSRINKLGELLTVSTLGLVVNLVGLTAFGHAHHGHSHGGHSHGGHSHGDHSHAEDEHSGHSHRTDHYHDENCQHEHSQHSHAHHDHATHAHHHENPSQTHNHAQTNAHAHLDRSQDHSAGLTPSPPFYSLPATPSKPVHPHSHTHGHARHSHGHAHHDHSNENMQGIFLHVLADALGSVAVIISTILIHFYGWSGFDPLASCFIAVAIFASAIPLVTSSARTLLLTVPAGTEYDLREALADLSALRGVAGYTVPKFWLEEGEQRRVLGVVHVIAGKMTDMEDVKERASALLREKNMDVVVQVEREGNSRCWCQAR